MRSLDFVRLSIGVIGWSICAVAAAIFVFVIVNPILYLTEGGWDEFDAQMGASAECLTNGYYGRL